MLGLLLVHTAIATPCEVLLDVIPHQQQGPRCLIAATATAVSARGGTIDRDILSKTVPLKGGTDDPIALRTELASQGWDTLLFTGPPESVARLVEAGFAPVMMLNEADEKHAVTVVGVRRLQAPDGRCLGPVADLAIVDPKSAATRWLPAADAARAQWAEQLLISFEPTAWGALDDAGFQLGVAVAADRRTRAEALVVEAQATNQPSAKTLELLERAVSTDPSWDRARNLRNQQQKALFDPPP
jgi:hypothetical protein